MAGGSLDIGTSSSDTTSRSNSGVQFPTDMLLKIRKYLGFPTTAGDFAGLFRPSQGPLGSVAGGIQYTPPENKGTGDGTYTVGDIAYLYAPNDAEKRMDLVGAIRRGGLKDRFTLAEFYDFVIRADDYGFSGRSSGDLLDVYGQLQKQEELDKQLLDPTRQGKFSVGDGTEMLGFAPKKDYLSQGVL